MLPLAPGSELLAFRCTACGNCCREPLLPVSDGDVRRILDGSDMTPMEIVNFVDRDAIDMDDEPQAFIMLEQGKRVMILRHRDHQCVYLGEDERCAIYDLRPLGCRIYPFDPKWTPGGGLRRLQLIQAAECPYEMDGDNKLEDIRSLHTNTERAQADYYSRVESWNREQRRRRRRGLKPQTTRRFLEFLGFEVPRRKRTARAAVQPSRRLQ